MATEHLAVLKEFRLILSLVYCIDMFIFMALSNSKLSFCVSAQNDCQGAQTKSDSPQEVPLKEVSALTHTLTVPNSWLES